MTTKRLYLIDGGSLYQTAMSHYRGKVDYAVLMENLSEHSSEDFDAVLFHEETRSGSQVFQSLVRGLGYRLVVVPPWKVGGTIGSSRSLPVHLSAYVMSRTTAYTHFDFVSGEVDYSPLSKYLISTGAEVRFWLFADRIPSYEQGDPVFHSIVPLNERYIMAQDAQPKRGDSQIPDLLDRVPAKGCVEIEPSEVKTVKVEVPGFTFSKPAKEKVGDINDALDAGTKLPKGCVDI